MIDESMNRFFVRNVLLIAILVGYVRSIKVFTQSKTLSITFISSTKINPTNLKQQQQQSIGYLSNYKQQITHQKHSSLYMASSIETKMMDDFVSNNNTATITTTSTTTGSRLLPLTNSELSQRRIQEYQIKKNEKYELSQRKAQRNLHTKRIVEEEKEVVDVDNTTKINLIQIKVIVDDILRTTLKLSGREKRGRIFIESNSNITTSYNLFKREIHAFFRALQKDTYLLYASLSIHEISDVTTTRTITASNNNITTGTTNSTNNTEFNNNIDRWEIRNDNEVTVTFQRAMEHFENQQQSSKEENVSVLTRPTFVLHVVHNPNCTTNNNKNSIPSFLQNMPNPNDSTTITMLSFYSFGNIENPDDFAKQLKKLFIPFNALGRIYVANEGINAQMSVPTNVLQQFITVCEYHLPDPNISYYLRTYGNSVNIDPIPLTIDEFNVAGIPSAASTTTIEKDGTTTTTTEQQQNQPCPPFTALHVRVRQQIVSDGLEKPYDWIQAGYDMPPLEWHTKLLEAKKLREEEEQRKQSDTITGSNNNNDTVETTAAPQAPIILDCRNTYETDVGIFDGAIPLQTTTFKDTWDAIEQQLSDKPKDTPIFMYCTGGIRCVKVGAYVTQQLGYTNVNRLAGGIIAYDRALTTNFSNSIESSEEKSNNKSNCKQVVALENNGATTGNSIVIDNVAKSTNSLFKGTNFVFDGRLGRSITDDAMGTCITCGCKTTFVSNCRNNNCHKRMVQCDNCHTDYYGTCSTACRNRYNLIKQRQQTTKEYTVVQSTTSDVNADSADTVSSQQPYTSIDSYSSGHSSPLPGVYPEMEFNTKALIPSGSHMVSGQAQGRLLKQFATMTREGRILELGTFTGYATACFLEGSIEAGKIIGTNECGSRSNGPYVLSLERDMKAFDVAVSQLQIISEYGFHGDAATEAMCSLRSNIDPTKVSKSTGFVDNQSVSITTPDNIALCEVMKVSDALATVEEMVLECSSNQEETRTNNDYIAPFDLVFVDADKTRLLDYVEVCLSTDNLLKKGGLIIVDNVLWKGLVLNASSGGMKNGGISNENDIDNDGTNSESDTSDNENDNDGFTIPLELRKNRRARKLANKLHRFNTAIVKDNRVEVLLLPIRDGLSIIRKK